MPKLLLLLLACFTCCLSFTALGQGAYRKVKPKPGDGLSTLLARHGLNTKQYERDFIALNKPLLGRGNSLVSGKLYRLPKRRPVEKKTARAKSSSARATAVKTTAALTQRQLFGPNGQPAPRSQQLRGAVYHLLSGHGGPDPGAVGQYGSHKLAEDEYAYDVTIRLARALTEHGAKVYMIVQDPDDGIRDEAVLKLDNDEITYPNLTIPLNHVARLRQYTAAINRQHARHKGAYQRMITLHVDSRSAGMNTDVFFYHHENSAVGKRLANNIHKEFTNRYKRSQPNRPYVGTVSARTSLYVVRNSLAPTVFIELGNIRNDKDQRRFVPADNRQALANWICNGLITDYRQK